MEEPLKNKRTANIVLALSVGIFISALLFFIVSTLNNPNGFFSSNGKEDKIVLEEYLYYDITSNSAKLYINVEVPINQVTTSCKPENGQAKKFESKTNEIILEELTPNTAYSCSITVMGTDITLSQSAGGFTTQSEEYLNITDIKADAYDVSFNVVFRASWNSEASSFLITKSLLDKNSNIISQEEIIISENKYLDNNLEIGKKYQYELRAIAGSSLGEPVIFNFTVTANQRLEDLSVKNKSNSIRILEPSFSYNNKITPNVSLSSFSEIESDKYNSYVYLTQNLPIMVSSPLGLDGKLLAGVFEKDSGFTPVTLYETPEKKELQIRSAELKGKELKISFNYDIEEVSYYSPDGILHISKINKATDTAMLGYDYAYINIKVGSFFVKVNQASSDGEISYDSDSGKLSWNAPAHYRGFLLIISTTDNKEIYRVGTSSTEYIIDTLPNLDKIKINIIGYPDFDNPISLGSQLIRLPDNPQSITVKNLIIEKAGNSLAITWSGDMRNEHEIQISPRNKNVWQTISTVPKGNNSLIYPDIVKLNTGNYSLRIVPKREDVLGKPYNYECYLKVDKNINYQIICE